MSKPVTTTGYIVAWVVAAVALIVFLKAGNWITGSAAASAQGNSPVSTGAWFVAGIASLVMLVLWIGALVALGRHLAWGWFAAVLVLQIVGLGIVGMVAYAIAGPPDRPVPSVTRPSFT